jgi:hypothetical protein
MSVRVVASAAFSANTFEIPQCDVDSAKRAHEDCSAAVEPQAPAELPDVFDVPASQGMSVTKPHEFV